MASCRLPARQTLTRLPNLVWFMVCVLATLYLFNKSYMGILTVLNSLTGPRSADLARAALLHAQGAAGAPGR